MSDGVNVVAVTLATRTKPVMLMGTLTQNALHVIAMNLLPASVGQIRSELERMRNAAIAAGHSATWFVEDPTGLLSGAGYDIRLDEKVQDGRPILTLAIERYQALTAVGGLIYPDKSGGQQFAIPNSIVNTKVGDNGRTSYEIDWSQLKDASRALMLLIYGAMCQGPMQVDYLTRLYDAMGTPAQSGRVMTSFSAVTVGFDAARAEKIPTVAGWRKGIL